MATAAVPRSWLTRGAANAGYAAVPRLLAAIALLTLIAAPAALPRAAAGEPGSTPFLQVRIDRVTPEVVTTTSEPVVTVTGTVLNVGDRPVRDVMVRLEDGAAVTSSAGLRTNLTGNVDQFQPVADFITLAPELLRGQDVPFTLAYPLRSADLPSLAIETPGVYPVMVNVNGTPDYGAPARLDDARFLLPVLGVPPDPAADSAADALTAVVPPDTSKPVGLTHAVAIGRPATPGRRRSRRNHAGAVARRRARGVAGPGRPARHAAVGRRFRDQSAGRPGGAGAQRAVPGRRPRPARHRQRDDGRLCRQRRARRRPGHADASRRRPGGRGGLAESAQGVGAADVCGADVVCAGRPGRVAARRGSGSERDRHQRRGRHRRPDPGHPLNPWRHPRRRRTADRPGRATAVGAGPHASRSPPPTSPARTRTPGSRRPPT